MTVSIPSNTLEKFTTFGDLLRFLRRRVGLTQTELAIAVGYGHTQISRLEQNLRLPDIPTIQARFVPALGLEEEPKAIARLLDLAVLVRREDAPALGLCPYKGLNYFDEADADLFMGREALTAKLVNRVLSLTSNGQSNENRFLGIVGASGSGKSSLVRAGLVPALRWNQESTDWQIHILTPTAYPLESLAASLTLEDQGVTATTLLVEDLARDLRSLQIFAKRKLGSKNGPHLLLVVDQFEELFALCRSEDERASFIGNLLTASSETDGPVILVITLRADFYAQCAGYSQLREALAHHQEYIGAMNDEELKRAIEEPAQRGRWEFEPGLVDLLLHDVGHEPGALPLLSHALLETWQRRRGRMMTLSGYASSGGVRGAITETAETVFTDQFTHEQQAIARRIFLRLTELSDETSTADTRRRATINELILNSEEAATTHAVLKALADARLIVTSEDSAEVAHEALIREWQRLHDWLTQDREGLLLHRHLTESAREWETRGKDANELYRGARLAQAREWAAANPDRLNESEQAFLAASVEQEQRDALEREAQRLRELENAQKLAQTEKARAEEHIQSANRLLTRNRVITTVGGIALALAVLASVFSLQSNQNAISAQTAQAAAEMNYANAESLRLAAEANVILSQNGDPRTAALLSIRALRSAYSAQADASLIRSLSSIYDRKIFIGHAGPVSTVAFSPDGKYALSGNLDGSARLWDVQTGQEIHKYIGHTGGILAVAFSPNGKFVVTGGDDQSARVWDIETGKQLHVFNGLNGSINAVGFSADGKYMLAAVGNEFIYLWNAMTGKSIREFILNIDQNETSEFLSYIKEASFSPDGKDVLPERDAEIPNLWEVATGMEFHPVPRTLEDNGVISLAFSPHAKYVLTGEILWTAELLEVETGQKIHTFRGHVDSVTDVAFSPDGKYVLTGSQDKTAILWDAQNGQEVRRYLGHDAAVNNVAFSPDGQYILTGSEDMTVRLWATPTASPLLTFIGHTKGITNVAYSPNGKYVLTGSEDHTARLWDAETNQELRVFAGHTKGVTSVAFSPDGKYVLTGSEDQTARLWDTETGQELRAFVGHVSGVASVAFSPDGKYVLTTGLSRLSDFGGETLLWNIGTGKKVRTFEEGPGRNKGKGSMLAFSPDGKKILIRGFDGDVYLLDTATAQELGRFAHIEPVNSVAFSPNGKFVLTGSNDKTARLWDAATGEELRIFTDQTSAVLSVSFAPDGKYLLTSHSDNTARIWNTISGQALRTFTGHADIVTSVSFSPDGKYVITGSEDGTVRLWHTDYDDTIRFACSLLWHDLTEQERNQYNITDITPTCPMP